MVMGQPKLHKSLVYIQPNSWLALRRISPKKAYNIEPWSAADSLEEFSKASDLGFGKN